MNHEFKDAFGRLEQGNNDLATALVSVNEQMRVSNARLDEIVALLTPKDNPEEPSLSELLAHMIAQQREQLMLTRKIVDLTLDIHQSLPAKLVDALEARFSALSKV